eukprot:TRINITY_DN24637_c0_g1_i1.p1 TRINITY_DN24637_c0_g1~~TRINITY_DN24637_c0_g1_i1.p1  ORF type:complete len:685 (+),score=98.25 TRINITY_DN24637_c0_g1_i1:269-2056(+)
MGAAGERRTDPPKSPRVPRATHEVLFLPRSIPESLRPPAKAAPRGAAPAGIGADGAPGARGTPRVVPRPSPVRALDLSQPSAACTATPQQAPEPAAPCEALAMLPMPGTSAHAARGSSAASADAVRDWVTAPLRRTPSPVVVRPSPSPRAPPSPDAGWTAVPMVWRSAAAGPSPPLSSTVPTTTSCCVTSRSGSSSSFSQDASLRRWQPATVHEAVIAPCILVPPVGAAAATADSPSPLDDDREAANRKIAALQAAVVALTEAQEATEAELARTRQARVAEVDGKPAGARTPPTPPSTYADGLPAPAGPAVYKGVPRQAPADAAEAEADGRRRGVCPPFARAAVPSPTPDEGSSGAHGDDGGPPAAAPPQPEEACRAASGRLSARSTPSASPVITDVCEEPAEEATAEAEEIKDALLYRARRPPQHDGARRPSSPAPALPSTPDVRGAAAAAFFGRLSDAARHSPAPRRRPPARPAPRAAQTPTVSVSLDADAPKAVPAPRRPRELLSPWCGAGPARPALPRSAGRVVVNLPDPIDEAPRAQERAHPNCPRSPAAGGAARSRFRLSPPVLARLAARRAPEECLLAWAQSRAAPAP